MVFPKGLFDCKPSQDMLKTAGFAVRFCPWKKRCSHRYAQVATVAKPSWLALKERAAWHEHGGALSAPRSIRGASMTNVFEEIYQTNAWGNSESHSGHGSSETATRFLRAELLRLLSDLGVRSMLDVPCGDFNWMRLLDLPVDYFGADIVPQLIEANQKKYSRPGRAFGLLDAVKDPLPRADVVFSRDLLVHLSEQDIRSALRNIFDSGATYLVTTTFTSRGKNVDIPTGQWRVLNFQRPPFFFPRPIRLINEHCEEGDGLWADKCLGIWKISDLMTGAPAAAPSSERPRVSVIIPTDNRARFIGDAVASALGQDYLDIEVIVVDVGSTDETKDDLATFRDQRLVCLHQANTGPSRARNRALAMARGEYITFLNPDDYYLPSKVGTQVAFLDANAQFGMAYMSGFGVSDDRFVIDFKYEAPAAGAIYPCVAFPHPRGITLPDVMVRREILDRAGGFDESMQRFEEADLLRRLTKLTPAAPIDAIGCHRRTLASQPESFDSETIASAIDCYAAKIGAEDRDVDPLTVGAGVRRLYEFYAGAARLGKPTKQIGMDLSERGRKYFEPLVSIVIPVYNGANYLSLAIDSAISQTYKNTEIIVVNDGSSDNGATARIAQAYGDRIRYFEKKNGGVATALNLAVAKAKGELIAWVSHDDVFISYKIQRQIDFLAKQTEPGSCVVYGDYSVFSNDSSDIVEVALQSIDPQDFRYFITVQNILHGCTLLIPKAAFERHGLFDERLRTTQDYDFWFRIAEDFDFLHLPGVVVRSRSHEEQGTRKLRDVALTEANNLLSRFAEQLTDDQIRRGSSLHPYIGCHAVAASFFARGFDAAGQRATELAGEKLRALASDDAARDELNRALAASFGKRMAKSEKESESMTAIGPASEVEIARLQRRLDEVYLSSSWKIAREIVRPFQRIHRSISKRAASWDRRLDMLFASTSSKAAREAIRPFRRISRSLSKLAAQ
jgi:glycosyltransferase involved in cell wall biosynthesis